VVLAFSVVRPRQLLVLEEAQVGLDAPSDERFQELLLEPCLQKSWTVPRVSHDLEMVRRRCDQVQCLNQRLRCSGALYIIDKITQDFCCTLGSANCRSKTVNTKYQQESPDCQ
jgi:ABC-type Mn2+/Zn2+ transport system ATPase subunit